MTHDFCRMVRCLEGSHLDAWITKAQASTIEPLWSFAKGLLKDYAAVKAGLTLSWSNGQTEAQVQRLKLVKRQMYGQASFALLRTRVLYRGPVRIRYNLQDRQRTIGHCQPWHTARRRSMAERCSTTKQRLSC